MKRRKPKVDREFPPEVRAEVYWRAGGFCERCGRHPIREYHHRLRRGQGGMGTLDNCAGLCDGWAGSCHAWVHANIDDAVEQGWLIRSGPVNMGPKAS